MSKERWIEEVHRPHERVLMKADRVLHEARTAHHHLVVFENAGWGTVLMLDGACRLTTADAFVEAEMLAHVPLMALDRPRHVLVVGGGDGGVLREVLRHPSVMRATLCADDRGVIDIAVRYFPQVSAGAFDDARSDIVVAEAARFVGETRERFDAIIIDAPHFFAPGTAAQGRRFLADCRAALKDGGTLVARCGQPFLAPDELATASESFAGLFKRSAPYLATSPGRHGGSVAMSWGSDDGELLHMAEKKLAKRAANRKLDGLAYWTPAVHRAAFALPAHLNMLVERAAGRGSKAAIRAKAKKAR